MPIKPPSRLTAWHAAAIYAAAAIAWSWPLLPNITSRIAWDLGDPMLVAWIMGWVNDSAIALVRGDVARFMQLWDAPIFHPEPLALAYSEHFIPQALMVLPIHAATGNVILSYNVALLATFVLSGTGMFLLTRALTGSTAAALLAGAIFAFTPYRVAQISHLQILSCQWMPLAIYGFRRFVETGASRPLVWGTLAAVAQCLSSGYLLLFFVPFLAAYVLWEIAARRLWSSSRTWAALSASAVASALLITPFLVPYLVVRRTTLEPRRYEEVRAFSADVYSYATSSPYIRWSADLFDAMRDVAENSNFPGVVAALLTALAIGLVLRRVRFDRRTAVFAGLSLLVAGVALWIALTGGRVVEIAGEEVRLRNVGRVVLIASALFAIAVAFSARLRASLSGAPGSLAGISIVFAVAAMFLSFGPRIESRNEFIGHGPYALLFQYVPGFDGLRVPSRFALVAIFWTTIAGAYAAAAIARRGRAGATIVLVLALGAAAESWPRPFQIDFPFPEKDAAPLTMTHRLRAAEPLYSALRQMPRGVLIELPWGTTGWDLQFMHAQRRHGWPLVNGFSGDFPPIYRRTSNINRIFDSPEQAWLALEQSGASHVIVHEWAFPSFDRGKRVSQWLRDFGAVELTSTDNDTLFRLPNGPRHR